MDIYKISFILHEANITADRKSEHCNTADEEDISSMVFCLEKS